MSLENWSPGTAHYTHFLGPILKAMSVDDLVKESSRNPFEGELLRRQEEARRTVEQAQYHQRWVDQQVEDARKRFEHL